MGKFNSSITRVWPVFDLLLDRDANGTTWLKDLLRLAPKSPLKQELLARPLGNLLPHLSEFTRPIPRNLRKELGPQWSEALQRIRWAFEVDLYPPAKFLRWLLNNPKKLSWPGEHERRWRELSETTKEFRSALKRGCPKTTGLALQLLERQGPEKSWHAWWALEGRTSVDCYLETDELILLIEGKRTEKVSDKTLWFAARDQLVRNLEVAAAEAARAGKNFAVLLCAEEHLNVNEQTIEQSLPHFSRGNRDELAKHYLGCITWEQIRSALFPEITLPDQIKDAVESCLAYR